MTQRSAPQQIAWGEDLPSLLWIAAGLLAAALLAYRRFTFGPGVPGGYDTQTYFFPYHTAVVRDLLHGRFPLWENDLFLGAPLFANIQSAVLYLPNVFFFFIPIPEAIATSVVLHVWWGAFGAAVLCRRTWRVHWLAAFIGGIAFGLGGFFSAQAGHLNQVDAAAWLPWLILGLDAAWQQRRARYVATVAVIVALQFLAGHTQESYYLLVIAALWIVWRLFQHLHAPRMALFIALMSLLAVILGIGLSGVQLLPTYELAQQSIRSGGLPLGEASSFSLRPDQLLREFLPAYSEQPASTEYVGYVGVGGFLLAVLGMVSIWKRQGGVLLLGLLVLGIALAFGLYSPVWHAAWKFVPGFASFRVPARALYMSTFALSLLASVGADVTLTARPRFAPAMTPLWVGLIVGAAALGARGVLGATGMSPLAVNGLTAVATAAAIALALTRRVAWGGRLTLALLCAGELVVAASWLPPNQPVPRQVYSDLQQTVTLLQNGNENGRALSIARSGFVPGDEATREAIGRLTAGKAAAVPTSIYMKYQDVLTPNLPLAYGVQSVDGYDGGILPLRDYVLLKSAFLPPCPICSNPDALLRDELSTPPSPSWLDLLGIGTIVNDRLQDFHWNGLDFDLTFTSVLPRESSLALHLDAAEPASTLGFVVSATTQSDSGPAPTMTVILHFADGSSEQAVEGIPGSTQLQLQPIPVAVPLRAPAGAKAQLLVVQLPTRRWISSISIQALQEPLDLHAVTIYDALTRGQWQLPPTPSSGFKRVLRGDVSVYEASSPAPFASLYGSMRTSGDNGTIAKELSNPSFPLSHTLLLSYPDFLPLRSLASRAIHRIIAIANGDPRLPPPPPSARCTNGTLTVQQQRQVITAQTSCSGPSYLLLRQSWYPGWKATVDGHRVPIYRADLALQAVPVPAGRHTVRVWYAPASVWLGAIASVIATILLAGLPWLLRPLSWLIRPPANASTTAVSPSEPREKEHG
ncbi:MAG: YfhO family protein [Chloroflexi bacterium]|nr:YfhO family protein [Chloroflexota bacterium]